MSTCTKKMECTSQFLTRIIQHPVTWVVLFVIAIIPIILSLWRGGIGYCDSCYYLLYVGKIAEGYIPYKTIGLGYTPLWFYLMYALSAPLGISFQNPEYFLFWHYCFVLANAYFVYLITKYFSQHKYSPLFASWLFLILTHCTRGNFILLEMPCVFWGLLASVLILYHRKKSDLWYMVYGVIAACSLLTKQYGFGYFALCILLMLFDEKKVKRISLFCCGYMIPVAACFAYWGQDLLPVIFSSYGTKSAVEAGRDVSFLHIIKVLLRLFKNFLVYTLPAWGAIILYIATPLKDKTKIREWLYCISGFCGFWMTFVFSHNAPHYLIYIAPFVTILMGIITSHDAAKFKKWILYSLIIFNAGLLVSRLYINNVYNHYIKNGMAGQYAYYQTMADKVAEYADDDDVVWFVHAGIFHTYYFGYFMPPNIKEYGYSFGPLAISEEKAIKNIQASDYVVYTDGVKLHAPYFTDSVYSLLRKYKTIDLGDGVIMYDMHNTLQNNSTNANDICIN